MNVYKSARLTPKIRAELALRISSGQSKSAAAMVLGICARTAAKWFRRYCVGAKLARRTGCRGPSVCASRLTMSASSR